MNRGEVVIATGPLTSEDFATCLREVTGADSLYFYDSIAPILDAESLDRTVSMPCRDTERAMGRIT